MFNLGSLRQILHMARGTGAPNILGLIQNPQQLQPMLQQFGQQFGSPDQMARQIIQSGQIPPQVVDSAVKMMQGMGISYDPRQGQQSPQDPKPFKF